MKMNLMKMDQKRNAFTIVELLVVIGIIAILAGLLLPVLGRVKEKGRITRAKAEVNNLASAVAQYQSAYTVLPAPDAAATADLTFTNDNWKVMTILCDIDTAPNPPNANHKKNPQKIRFFDPKAAETKDDPGFGPDNVLRDPWANPYVITLDLNYDNQCKDAFYCPGNTTLPCSAAVWSFGPDGLPNTKDDVVSWK